MNASTVLRVNHKIGALLCLTAGEDGALRCTVLPTPESQATMPCDALQEQCVIGTAAGGAAIKGLAVLPLAAAPALQQWLIVSGGSKEVLMVWRVWVDGSGGGRVQHEELHVQLPKKGLRQTSDITVCFTKFVCRQGGCIQRLFLIAYDNSNVLGSILCSRQHMRSCVYWPCKPSCHPLLAYLPWLAHRR